MDRLPTYNWRVDELPFTIDENGAKTYTITQQIKAQIFAKKVDEYLEQIKPDFRRKLEAADSINEVSLTLRLPPVLKSAEESHARKVCLDDLYPSMLHKLCEHPEYGAGCTWFYSDASLRQNKPEVVVCFSSKATGVDEDDQKASSDVSSEFSDNGASLD